MGPSTVIESSIIGLALFFSFGRSRPKNLEESEFQASSSNAEIQKGRRAPEDTQGTSSPYPSHLL